MEKTDFRLDVQGLRALAVLLVVLYHAKVPPFDGGFVGVDVFFVISGFVIGRSLLREVASTGTIRLREFYKRRVRRLLPAFSVMAIATFVFTVFFLEIGDVQRTAAQTGIAAAFSVANLALYRNSDDYFSVSEELNPFLHTWSLAVEEQFYLVTPALLVGLLAVSRSVRWSQRSVMFGGLVAASLASFAFSVIWTSTQQSALAFYSPISRFWEIAVGVCLAFAGTRQSPARGRAAGLAAVAIIAASVWFGPTTIFPGVGALLPVGATAFVLAWAPSSRALSTVLEHRALVWIGDRSYGWYLWHWPCVVVCRQSVSDGWVALLVASCIALVPAALSYRLIEQPMNRRPRWSLGGIRLLGAAAASVVALTVAGSVVQAGADRSWGLDVDLREPDGLAYVNGCDTASGDVSEQCVFAPPGETSSADAETIVLVGDSHATSLADGVIAAGNRNGFTVVVVTAHGCPFIDVSVVGSCDRFRDAAWAAITEHDPSLVFLAQNSAWYLRAADGPDPRVKSSTGDWMRSHPEIIDAWSRGITAAHDRLAEQEIALVSIDVVPVFSNELFGGSATILSPTHEPGEISIEHLEHGRADIVEAEHAALASGHWVDPADALCDAVCSTVNEAGAGRYFDGSHLNRAGSLELADLVESAIHRLVPASPAPS